MNILYILLYCLVNHITIFQNNVSYIIHLGFYIIYHCDLYKIIPIFLFNRNLIFNCQKEVNNQLCNLLCIIGTNCRKLIIQHLTFPHHSIE